MAYSAKVGSFNIDTTKTAGQTQAITGVGFTPKIVLFWWSGATATTDGARGEDINFGFGAMSGASARFAVSGMSDDGAATTATACSQRTDACIMSYLNGTTSQDGAADWGSLDADGFTLTIDNQFSTAIRVSYLALGGTDLTNVYIGSFQMPTATGNYSRTGVGFQPSALITCSSALLSESTSTTSLYWMLGMATGSGARGVVNVNSSHGVATTASLGYGYNGEINNGLNSAHRDAVVSFDADGFTFNHLEGTAARYYYVIALKGGQYSVGDITTRTDGNDITETVGSGFQPVALFFASANRALSTQDAMTDELRLSIGAATSTTNRAVMAVVDDDNLADSQTATANYDSAVYAHVQNDVIQGLMDIKSIDATGFTAVMDDADTSACWVTYLAIGATGGGGSTYEESVSISEKGFVNTLNVATLNQSTSMSEKSSISDGTNSSISQLVSVAEIKNAFLENTTALNQDVLASKKNIVSGELESIINQLVLIYENENINLTNATNINQEASISKKDIFSNEIGLYLVDQLLIHENKSANITNLVSLNQNTGIPKKDSISSEANSNINQFIGIGRILVYAPIGEAISHGVIGISEILSIYSSSDASSIIEELIQINKKGSASVVGGFDLQDQLVLPIKNSVLIEKLLNLLQVISVEKKINLDLSNISNLNSQITVGGVYSIVTISSIPVMILKGFVYTLDTSNTATPRDTSNSVLPSDRSPNNIEVGEE